MQKNKWKQMGVFGLALSLTLQGVMPAGEVFGGSSRAGSIYYLSDMPIKSSTNDYGQWTMDKDFDTNKAIELKMSEQGTVLFEKGLTANADATATYDVSSYAGKAFFAYVGVHYGQLGNPGGTCDFELQIDGESMWQSAKVLGADDAAEKVLVDIPEGAKEMTLCIGTGDDDGKYDHGVWAQACILDNKELLRTVETVFVDAPGFLGMDEAGKITVQATCFDKTEAEIGRDIEVECQSSDESVAALRQEGQDWIVTGKKNGSATIQVTVTDKINGSEQTVEKNIAVTDDVQSISSPNGEQKISFLQTSAGAVCYKVFTDAKGIGKVVATGDATGLVTNLGDFSTGLSLVDMMTQDVSDSYDIIGGKKTHVDAAGKEMVLKFEKTPNNNGVYFYVIARAYDDGVAFRYQISAEEKQDLSISREKTSLVLPNGAISQAMEFVNHNEAREREKTNIQMTGAYCMPLLYETEGTFCLFSEAALSQEYAGAALYGDGSGRLEVRFSEGDLKPTSTVTTSTMVRDPWGQEEHDWVSPWRFFVIGDLNTINGNTMAETLSPENVIEDTSWIKPGSCGWTWLNGEGTGSYETYKEYVDLAAEMGWEYVLLDEGWQPRSTVSGYVYHGYYDWFDSLMEYANEKGVGLIVWANHQDLNTPAKQEVLAEWAQKGVKGIKPDFFNTHSQTGMQLYMQLYQKTAENKLLLNVHGAPKTTGERRTYPHLVTREGIHGAEQIIFDRAGVTARHNCTLPFVRNAVGPADFTPMLSTRVHNSPYGGGATYSYEGKYTTGQMAAMPIMIESGVNCMADTADVYLSSPVRPLYFNLPAEWESSQVMEAEIGKYATIRRESADGRWYIGTICDAARTTDLSLDFLPAGEEYYAYIAEDGQKSDELIVRMEKVSSADTLHLELLATGGALILIQKEAMTEVNELVLSEHEVEMSIGESRQLTASMTPEEAQIRDVTWSSSDESVVTVKNGQITSVGVGVAAVTATHGTISDSCQVKVYPSGYETNDVWSVVNEDKEYYSFENENVLTIRTQSGGIYLASKNTANNEFFMNADKDFEVSVKLSFAPTGNYQSAGLLALADNKSYAGVWRRYHSSFGGNVLNMVNYNGSSLGEGKRKAESQVNTPIWLKLVKEGNTLTSYTSEDGEIWTALGTETNARLNEAGSVQIGVYAANDASGRDSIPAVFENFTYQAKGGNAAVVPFGKKPVRQVMGIDLLRAGKTNYQIGDAFDASEYSFQVYYSDKTSKKISGANCEVTGFDSDTEGKQEVTFTYQGQTAKVAVYVTTPGVTVDEATKNMLQVAYDAYQNLDTSAFTSESSAVLAAALETAGRILNGEAEDGQTAGDALTALMQAAAGLVIDNEAMKQDVEAANQAAQAAMDAAEKVAKEAKEAAAAIQKEAADAIAAAKKEAADAVAAAKKEAADAIEAAKKEAEEAAKKEAEEAAKKEAEAAIKKAEAAAAQKLAEVMAQLEKQSAEAKAAIEAAKKVAEQAQAEASAANLALGKVAFKSSVMTLKSVKSAGKKKLKVKWDKVENAQGYEIRYATNASFKKAKKLTVKSGAANTGTIRKLTSGKKYYVKVRAYQTFDGKKVYTAYSKTKKVRVK